MTDAEDTGTVEASVKVPTSALKGRSLAGLLMGGMGLAATAGAGAGYVSGGLSAEQQLEVTAQIQQVRDELRDGLVEMDEESRERDADLSGELSFIRGKLEATRSIPSEGL